MVYARPRLYVYNVAMKNGARRAAVVLVNFLAGCRGRQRRDVKHVQDTRDTEKGFGYSVRTCWTQNAESTQISETSSRRIMPWACSRDVGGVYRIALPGWGRAERIDKYVMQARSVVTRMSSTGWMNVVASMGRGTPLVDYCESTTSPQMCWVRLTEGETGTSCTTSSDAKSGTEGFQLFPKSESSFPSMSHVQNGYRALLYDCTAFAESFHEILHDRL